MVLNDCRARHRCADNNEGTCSQTAGHLGKHLCASCLRFFSSPEAGSQDRRLPTPVMQAPQFMELAQRRDLLMQFLREQGYSPSVDRYGYIWFAIKPLTFLAHLEDKDEDYIQFALPNIYKTVTNDYEKGLVLLACTTVSTRVKAAKVCLVDTMVVVFVELFCSPFESFRRVFQRCLDSLESAAACFYEAVDSYQHPPGREEPKPDEGDQGNDAVERVRLYQASSDALRTLSPALLAKQGRKLEGKGDADLR